MGADRAVTERHGLAAGRTQHPAEPGNRDHGRRQRDRAGPAGLAGAREPTSLSPCPVCEGHPRVLVALRHPAMRRFTRELLERECGCWVATHAHTGAELPGQLERLAPDLLVIDAADFPACCPRQGANAGFPPSRAVVIGPEPDHAYQQAARARGAGAWIPRERVGEELGPVMRQVLGCTHDPCPPVPHVHSR